LAIFVYPSRLSGEGARTIKFFGSCAAAQDKQDYELARLNTYKK
jgi:hypothetical protein